MTDREKQIEGILKVMHSDIYLTHSDVAIALYNAGYRKKVIKSNKKAIKKQIAKEILGELFNMAKMQGKHPIATPINWVDNIRAIAYKHGVEIDE